MFRDAVHPKLIYGLLPLLMRAAAAAAACKVQLTAWPCIACERIMKDSRTATFAGAALECSCAAALLHPHAQFSRAHLNSG